MKKKFYLENIESSSVIRKIEFDISLKLPDLNYRINKDTYVLTLEFEDEFYQDDLNQVLDIIKSNGPNIEISEKEQLPAYRKVLILEGLDCANCAAKIERIAKRNIDHEFIVVDFATARFIIETSNVEVINNITKQVQDIASSVDASIVVTTKTEQNQKTNENIKIAKWEKISFISGVLLFAIGVIVKYSLLSFGIIIPSQFVILAYVVAYILLGKDVIFSAFHNIISGRVFDEKFLMTLATVVALSIGFYEEAVSVMIFYKIGELCQEYAVNRSRKSIASLLDIKPSYANLYVNGDIVEVDPLEVVVGDIILVKAGERIPVDGRVIDGEASLDASALTGESKYIDVGVNDKVISGAISTNGTLKIKVDKIYADSTVSQILQMVENASSLKSKSENMISKLAKYYTPIVCISALLWALSPYLLKSNPVWGDFQTSIYAAMIFLVASCPCALVISIPLGFFGGIGGASRHGILIKGSNYLEALANVGSIVFDKTGTLTKGMFKVYKVVALKGTNEDLLEMAAYCEMTSNHPIAKSIISEYGKEKIVSSRIKINPKTVKFGNCIYLDDDEIAVGNDTFLQKLKIKVKPVDSDGVVVYVVKNMELLGYIIIKDEVRPEAKATIDTLKKMGISVAMVTGDKEIEARKVASEVGIDTIYFDMMPVDKVKKLRSLRKGLPENKKQIFVGDGINDAPVLSSADVGIAMGGLGSDAAIKVADVVLMNDDLSKLPSAIRIARKTKKIVIQNILLALIVKLIVLVLAPLGISHMWEAIFADVGVSLIAIINSLRAANIKMSKHL
jgi:Cd2+/Zn2+-exporting ATPase